MELLLGFLLIVSFLVMLDLVALRWGVINRHYNSDWMPRTELEYYEPQANGIS